MAKAKKSAPKVDPLIEGMFSKLLDRLVALEKKTDSILSRIGQLNASNGQAPRQAHPVQPPQPSRHERQMYEAICADCSKVCEVPFQPSESRPVYCKSCWAKRKGTAPGMPILRPVSIPPKPKGNLHVPVQALSAAPAKRSKAKTKPAKKSNKKK
jgi:CxxC-x17-CxxC domain-containing protein